MSHGLKPPMKPMNRTGRGTSKCEARGVSLRSLQKKLNTPRAPERNSELEREFERELDTASGRHGVGRLAEAGRFQKAHGDAEVGAVDKVEEVHAELQPALLGDLKALNHRQVQLQNVSGAKRVARNLTVRADRREQAGRINPRR